MTRLRQIADIFLQDNPENIHVVDGIETKECDQVGGARHISTASALKVQAAFDTAQAMTGAIAISDVAGGACFVKGTLMQTPVGYMRVEDIRYGDEIVDAKGHVKPVRFVGVTEISGDEMEQNPSLRPVRIAENSFGPGAPFADLYVSQQHRIYFDDWRVHFHFGAEDALAPAVGLLRKGKVELVNAPQGITYYQISCETHEVVNTQGLLTESCAPAPVNVDEKMLNQTVEKQPNLSDLHTTELAASAAINPLSTVLTLKAREASLLAH